MSASLGADQGLTRFRPHVDSEFVSSLRHFIKSRFTTGAKIKKVFDIHGQISSQAYRGSSKHNDIFMEVYRIHTVTCSKQACI